MTDRGKEACDRVRKRRVGGPACPVVLRGAAAMRPLVSIGMVRHLQWDHANNDRSSACRITFGSYLRVGYKWFSRISK